MRAGSCWVRKARSRCSRRVRRAAASKRAARACELRKNGHGFEARLEGPPNSLVAGEPALTIPLAIRADQGRARINVNGHTHTLEVGKLSDWITLTFPAAPLIKVSGICRMLVTEMGEHVSLYVTPINIDPEKPAMPISHPSYYSTYLAKKIGQYSTLGLAEDTWALNEGVIDDGTFLQQTYDIDAERERMFFAGLDKLRQGQPGVRLRRHRPHSAHVLALSRSRASGRTRARDRRASQRHRAALHPQRRARGQGDGAAERRRRPDGALRSRLQLVPPGSQSQQLAAGERLPHAQTRRRRQRRVAARRGLVADARLRPGPYWPVPQRQRAGGAGDCRGGRGRWRN